ncbi:MAG: arginine--tRNA ligase [Candidatus Woesebacteria bacterium]|nr:arginine--tRNA ligase [Candidatus Woesebacteria bacterium]
MSSTKEQIIKALQAITAFKNTPRFDRGDELNADMSSSFGRGNRGLKSAEDVITGVKEINLEFPENEAFGDYSTNIALLNKNLNIDELVEKFNRLDLPVKAEARGRFINFWLKKEVLVDSLIHNDIPAIGKGKTVIIDYSSPNIAKPFGIGHLRSTIIGQALYNLYKFLGYEVIGDNHLGDWGTQFGKLLYMITAGNVSDFDISKLEEIYVEFHRLAEKDPTLEEKAREWFKKLEEGDSQAREIWQKCVDISLEEFERVYELLGVKIDFAFGESYYGSEMKELLGNPSILKHVSEGEDGAKIIDLSGKSINTPLMLLKGDGGTTYATRDLATIAFRVRKWNPDIIIYEVGAEQSFYFKQLFAAARLLGLVDKKIEFVHTAHGLYLAEDGKKFATREGKTIRLDEVLNEAISRAEKLGNSDEKTAQQVGIGAIKYFDLMHSVQSNVVFDWEKMMNLEGNSGPYLQYTVARTNSVLAKSTNLQISKSANSFGKEINEEEMRILRTLVRFPEIIATAAINYSPNTLCSYLYDLAQKFNSFYNKHKIIGGENEEFKILLAKGTSQVLKTGLKLLGIETPERM